MRSGEDFREESLLKLQKTIGYSFQDQELLKTCFTHKSWSNVHGGKDNERLEFLGDAVVELIVSEALFSKVQKAEGELTELRQQFVSQSALEHAAEKSGLMEYLRYSGGENNVGGKTASNLFEALTGGIYLDGGLLPAKKFLQKFLSFQRQENYKSLLQEYVQESEKTTPSYFLKEVEGGYSCVVKALGKEASGEGASKKAAEMQAAKNLYEIFSKRDKR